MQEKYRLFFNSLFNLKRFPDDIPRNPPPGQDSRHIAPRKLLRLCPESNRRATLRLGNSLEIAVAESTEITGPEECPRYRLEIGNLKPCGAPREGAFARDILQLIKGRKDYLCSDWNWKERCIPNTRLAQR